MSTLSETELIAYGMPTYRALTLDEQGIEIQHGYEIRPWPGIAQVLWFIVRYPSNNAEPVPTTSFFWIEHATGLLQVIRLTGIPCHAETLIPALSRGAVDSDIFSSLKNQLGSGWILPPSFDAEECLYAPLAPTPRFIRELIRKELSALLDRKSYAEPAKSRLEKIVDLPTSSLNEKFGHRNIERHLLIGLSEEQLLPLSDATVSMLQDAETFRSRISSEILDFFEQHNGRLCGIGSIHNYNIVATWTGTLRRNRIQAMKMFSWLFNDFGLTNSDWGLFEGKTRQLPIGGDIVCAIDNGRPFIGLLARHFDVKPHTLRRAGRLLRKHEMHPEMLPAFLWFLDGVKVDFQPYDPSQLRALIPAVHWICNWHLDLDCTFVKRLSLELFKDGVGGAKRLFRQWCPSHNASNPFLDLEGFISECANQRGFTPLSGESLGALFREMVNDLGFESVFVASEQWHMNCWTQSHSCEELYWQPLLGAPVAAGNLVAYELFNTEMLFQEGAAMRHCIVSYASLCAAGNDFVFSMRTSEGLRRSTLHVAKYVAEGFIIMEHRAVVSH